MSQSKITQKPWLYKTELCKSFSTTGKCSYGARCQYAHGQAQLRPVTRHPKYKSRRCKNFDLGSCSYGSRCCFIHSDQKKEKNAGQRRRKNSRKKKTQRAKSGRTRNESKDARAVTRLQQRNLRNREAELAISTPTVKPPPIQQHLSSNLFSSSQWSDTLSKSPWSTPTSKSPWSTTKPVGSEPLLPIIQSSSMSPRNYKPQEFSSKDSQVKAILEGIGIIKPVIAAHPYGANAILEVDEYPYGTNSPIGTPPTPIPTPIVADPSPIVADPYRAKRLLPVYPVVSNTNETPEAEPPTWEEKNRGRLNVFKSMGNKSRSCRW